MQFVNDVSELVSELPGTSQCPELLEEHPDHSGEQHPSCLRRFKLNAYIYFHPILNLWLLLGARCSLERLVYEISNNSLCSRCSTISMAFGMSNTRFCSSCSLIGLVSGMPNICSHYNLVYQ
jgi:hypothetical protein